MVIPVWLQDTLLIIGIFAAYAVAGYCDIAPL